MLMAALMGVFLSNAPAQHAPFPKEEAILASALKHYPVVVQALEQTGMAAGQLLTAEGAWDAKLVGNSHHAPVGDYTRLSISGHVEKNLRFANTRIYAGYGRAYPGSPLPQANLLDTYKWGAPRVGGAISLLRGYAIDEKRAAHKRARYGLQQAQMQAALVQVQVRREARVTYWMLLSAVRNYHVHRDLLELAQRREAVLTQRVQAGDISKVVATENLQYVARRQTELAAAELALTKAALDLSLFHRDHDGKPIVLAPRDRDQLDDLAAKRVAFIESTSEAGAYPDLSAQKVGDRPDVLSISNELKANFVTIQQLENLYLPKIDLGFDYTKSLGIQTPSDTPHYLTFYLSIEVPLELNLLKGSVDAAYAQRRALGARYAFAIDNANVEIRQASAAIRLARRRMANAALEMSYATKLLEAETYKYEKGRSDLFLVNAREEARAQAESTYIFSQLEVIAAHAQYEAATATFRELNNE